MSVGRLVLFSLLAMIFTVAAYAADSGSEVQFYLAPNGSDAWSGSLSEPNAAKTDGPLATLEAARLKVRENISKGLSKPITVLVRGGEYTLDKTVMFTPEDSGSEQCPITYKAYPNEKPIFTGGKKLTGWKLVAEPPQGIHPKAQGKLWYVDIPAEMKGKWQITSLYDGTTMLKRSISSEFKTADDQVNDKNNACPKYLVKRFFGKTIEPVTSFSRQIKYNNNELRDWKNISDIEIILSPSSGWLINLLPLASMDTRTKTATYGIDSTYGIPPKNPYYVENAIDYLDEPGEWTFDSREGRIYIWPDHPLEKADIRAPYLQEFIRVEGVEDKVRVRFVNFAGLTFRHGLRDTWKAGYIGLQHDWGMYDVGDAMLRFRHAENASVKGCTFESSSGAGVRCDLYCQKIVIADSLFSHLGGIGILLSGYGAGLKDENKLNTITNNYLHHIGTIYKHSPAVFIAQSGHNLISHNTIHDLAYNGMVTSGCRPQEMMLRNVLKIRREWIGSIRAEEAQPYIDRVTPDMLSVMSDKRHVEILEPLLHSRENLIEYNEIYKVMLELNDGNAMYFSAMGKNNRVEYNYIHDVSNSRGNIRLDDSSGFTYLNYNVGVRSARMFGVNAWTFHNNFSIDSTRFIISFADTATFDRTIVYCTKGAKHTMEITANGVKTTGLLYSNCGNWSNSLLYDLKPIAGIEPGKDVVPHHRRKGAAVGMLYEDPLFDTDAFKQKIFRFKPGSPATKLGIEPIDLSTAGSTLAK